MKAFLDQKALFIHWWKGIPTRFLHAAVGLMDLYTWLQPIMRQDYQLLALGAFATAVCMRSPKIKINYRDLCMVTNDVYTQGQTRQACNYVFELGLCEEYLCQSSASLRCAAVLYLIRRIIQLKCDCGLKCSHCCMPVWPPTMVKFAGHRETTNLRRIAKFYGQLLLLTEEEIIPSYLNRCTDVTTSATVIKTTNEKRVEVSVRIDNGAPAAKDLKNAPTDSSCIVERELVPAREEGIKSDPLPAKFVTSANPGIGELWKAGTCDNVYGFNLEGGKSDPVPAKFVTSPNPGIATQPVQLNALGYHLQQANVLGAEVEELFTGEQPTDYGVFQNDEPGDDDRDPIAAYLRPEAEVTPLERSDIQEDYQVMRGYHNDFLSRSKLTPSLRAALLDWLTRIQMFTDSDTTVLHIAALILDRYTWTYPVTMSQYILVTIAAFLAAVNLTPRTLEIPALIDMLLKFSNHMYKKMDFVALCLYCFDLGLLNWKLVKYPASMKCAAVVYLARTILSNYCSCSHSDLHNACNECPYHRIEPWTPELASAIHYEDTSELYDVAKIYLTSLNEAQRLINPGAPESVPNCGPPFEQNRLLIRMEALIIESSTQKTSPGRFPIEMANAQLIARVKRGIGTMEGAAKKNLRILPSTYEFMCTFRGRWRRKSRDTVNDIQMYPLDEYTDAELVRETLYFRRILHYELIRDDNLIQEYNSNCLSMSKLTPSLRAVLFNWMIRVQQYYKFSSEALHVATTMVDRFTWRKLTCPERYQLVGISAVVLGIKLTTRKQPLPLDDLCHLTEDAYSTEEVQRKEEKMLKTFDYNLFYPIPHTFIGFSLIGFEDLPKGVDELVIVLLCRYIFDQGLTELSLAQYSASLKCAAAIYLIRYLLRRICQCPIEDRNICPFHSMTRWTDKMASVTGHKEAAPLKRVAFTYGLMLIEAQFFLNETTPGLMIGCGSSLRAAFKKHSQEKRLHIARHPLVSNFTIFDILDLDSI
ncbi:Cyclin-A3-4 [Taenia crassiceps]|uniref:Cyclin-A3-4 n=1 Tax=Taenia crassiceps TaxID=6207 RepID=A0ABR4Q409_9CEST